MESNSVTPLLPRIKTLFGRMGRLEKSSKQLFDGYLGQAKFPIIVGYESQLVEIALTHPESFDAIKKELRVVPPAHYVEQSPYDCSYGWRKALDRSARNPEIQRIAWEKHHDSYQALSPVEPHSGDA